MVRVAAKVCPGRPWWGWLRDWRGWRLVVDYLTIREGDELPPGYGLAWRCWDRDALVVMPVPLNVLAGGVRAAWHWLKVGAVPVSVVDRMLTEARARGRVEGHNDRQRQWERAEPRIRAKAFADGRRAVVAEILSEIKDEVASIRSEVS